MKIGGGCKDFEKYLDREVALFAVSVTSLKMLIFPFTVFVLKDNDVT